MVRFCPALSKRVKILESQKKITYLPTNSSYQVLSADVANKHGFNTHGVIFDELHTQPNRKLFDVMLQGSGDARMQPLYFLITTAGNDTNRNFSVPRHRPAQRSKNCCKRIHASFSICCISWPAFVGPACASFPIVVDHYRLLRRPISC